MVGWAAACAAATATWAEAAAGRSERRQTTNGGKRRTERRRREACERRHEAKVVYREARIRPWLGGVEPCARVCRGHALERCVLVAFPRITFLLLLEQLPCKHLAHLGRSVRSLYPLRYFLSCVPVPTHAESLCELPRALARSVRG